MQTPPRASPNQQLQGNTGEINIFEAQKTGSTNNYHCFDPTDGAATVDDVASVAGVNPTSAYHVYGAYQKAPPTRAPVACESARECRREGWWGG